LTIRIREYEAAQAPGGETGLLGDYLERMRILGLPESETTSQGAAASTIEITQAEYDWWIGAYEAQGADDEAVARGEEPTALKTYRATH
jgi:hypothetical protein